MSLQVQQVLGRDPHAGDLYVFSGARGNLIKIVWHDGIGVSLYAKRLERGRFLWPSPANGIVVISASQLAYMLDGIDWRNPVRTWRPEIAGCEPSPGLECGQSTHPMVGALGVPGCEINGFVVTPDDLPDDVAALQTALIAESERAARVEAELALAKAKASDDQAVIAHQQLQIAKLTRELYGQRSERRVQLLNQMALAFEELEVSASEDELAAKQAVAKTTDAVALTRKRPSRQPFPEHLPRERMVEPGPTACQRCGSPQLR